MHTNPRRGLARRFAAGLLAAALGLGGSLAQAATTLNLSYNGAADSEKNLVHLFASNLKRLAEEKSGGELQFKLYPNSMLGEEEQRMEQVMTGPGLNIASFAGIAPLFPEIYVSATPFMFKDAAAAHAFFDSGSYWKAAREAFRERTGTELLAVVEEGGFLNFTNGKKPIHGPADFQGLRFRAMDPSQVALYEAFGASGTPIPWTELYMGLRTGVADGQMNPTSYIILGSLYQVQKYLTLANIQYSDQFLVANGDLLASLPAKARQALLDAAAEATRLNREAVAAQQEHDLAFLKEKGMQIIQPSADDLAAFREKGQPSYLAWLKTQDIEPRWTEMAFRDAGLAPPPCPSRVPPRRPLPWVGRACPTSGVPPMPSLLKGMRAALLNLATLLLLLDLVLLIYGVFARYLLGSSPIWMDELARYLIIGAVMLALGAVWMEGGHMRVNLLEQRLPPRLAQVLRLYQWLLALAFFAFAAWVSTRYALNAGRFRSLGLGVSRTWPLLSLPLGFGLLTLMLLLQGPWPRQPASTTVEGGTQA